MTPPVDPARRREMTDDILDTGFGRDLRSVLRAQAPDDAPQSLRSFVLAVPRSQGPTRATHPFMTRLALVAAAAAVAVFMVAFYFSQSGPPIPAATGASATPTPTERPSPSLSRSPTVEFQIVAGGKTLTPAELQTISDVVFQRLSVYVPNVTRDEIAVVPDGS